MNQLRRRIQTAAMSGGKAVPPLPPFNPLDIAGLKLWLDASQIVGLNDGDEVTTWNDLSGGGYNATQATASKKPTYETNEQNGRPAVRFDGVDDYLANATLALAQPYSLFVAIKQTGGGVTGRTPFDGVPPVNRAEVFYDVGTSKWGFYSGAQLWQTGTSATGLALISVVANGASSEIKINGASLGSGNAGSQGLNGFYLAENLAVHWPFGGLIFEVIIYNHSLGAAEFNTVLSYINSKWAIY